MLNPFAELISKNMLQEQDQYIMEKRPYITDIYHINNQKSMKVDYLAGVDAIGIGTDGKQYNIQYKSRQSNHTDFVLIAKMLTGKAALDGNIGFIYNDKKFSFDTAHIDIWIETIAGQHYNITREEINCLERDASLGLSNAISAIKSRFFYADDGSSFRSGDYYVFIPVEKLNNLRQDIFLRSL